MKFRISRRADADLEAIWNYIAQDSLNTADRMEAALHSAMQLLASFPGLGHARQDVMNASYRFWNVFDYVIAYRVRGRMMIVVRVLHGNRDFRNRFGQKQ